MNVVDHTKWACCAPHADSVQGFTILCQNTVRAHLLIFGFHQSSIPTSLPHDFLDSSQYLVLLQCERVAPGASIHEPVEIAEGVLLQAEHLRSQGRQC